MMKQKYTTPKLEELFESLQSGDSVLIEELWDAPKALIATLAQQATNKHVLILTGESREEGRLYHDFKHFTDREVLDFPAWETMPNENIPPSPDIVGQRYDILQKILNDSKPQIIVSNLQACLQRLIDPNQFKGLYLTLKTGQEHEFELLQLELEEMGYVRQAVASDKGEFAVRGGIIDLFPVSSPDPFRIEFFGDEIESIRIYDPIGQKSVDKVQKIEITPAQEMELLRKTKHLSTILDYLAENTIVIFDDLLKLEDRYAQLVNIFGKPTETFGGMEELLDTVSSMQTIFWAQQQIDDLTEVQIHSKSKGGYYSESAPMIPLSFQMFNRSYQAKRWWNPFISVSSFLLPDQEEYSGEELLQALPQLTEAGYSLDVLVSSDGERETFRKRTEEYQIKLPEATNFEKSYLSTGFVLTENKKMVLPMSEITRRYKIRRQKLRSTYHSSPTEVFDLTPGEMVVHMQNGIGRYLGTEKRKNHQGIESEFLQIEYADDAKLYIPIDQSHLVSKYIGSSDELPKMHKLGSKRWQATRERTERSILGYASDLLQMYAKRELKGGYAYPKDTEDLLAFEEEFPFVETEDQLQASASIKEDMESTKAMDRLVCGDVGYGKTEVAMRAAFKTIEGGKQVAFLVPTTVLAMQHYENFCERFANFPVTIEVLSRFRTGKQIRTALEGLEKGTVDVIIGTHRLVSQDVQFKDLGLVIIDEEQRFGVRAKEHLKKIKTGVDCLTLSATPIPRTLYMSLIGARDMSVINTPPQDRLPIKTTITAPNENIVKNAILRELARDGQVYYIHNRVETIYEVANRLKKLFPQARIAVGHGQMHADELDAVFHAFKAGQADILVATTIVENGIDIPNANTILIDNADHFGLASLYQLRGRVGRWNRRAYAYFLVKNLHRVPEITRKRMQALAEASGYGGGMKLAMRDLEIRGAGDILGTEQSGQVAAIGFHLYCKLLKRTIRALEGKESAVICDTRIEHSLHARIPEDYIDAPSLRMEIYQRLGEALKNEDVEEIWEELEDRFGEPPEPVKWLYHLTRVRVFASQHNFPLLRLDKLTLSYERKVGKKSETGKLIVGKWQDPQEMESKIIEALKRVKT